MSSTLDAAGDIASDIGKGTATSALLSGMCVAFVLLCSGCMSVMNKSDSADYDTVEATVTVAECATKPATPGMPETVNCKLTVSYTHNGTNKTGKTLTTLTKYNVGDKLLIEVLKSNSDIVRLPTASVTGMGYFLILSAIFMMVLCGGSWWYITHTEGKGAKWLLVLLGICTLSGCARSMLK